MIRLKIVGRLWLEKVLKMADKLVTWVFALQFSDNFTVLWNEIKKIIHIYMFRTLLSTSWWKLYVKYVNFKFDGNIFNFSLVKELGYNLQTLYN
jgi:hypothetical protein